MANRVSDLGFEVAVTNSSKARVADVGLEVAATVSSKARVSSLGFEVMIPAATPRAVPRPMVRPFWLREDTDDWQPRILCPRPVLAPAPSPVVLSAARPRWNFFTEAEAESLPRPSRRFSALAPDEEWISIIW